VSVADFGFHLFYLSLLILAQSQVLPNMAFIPEIKATHYQVCGSVQAVNPVHARKVSSEIQSELHFFT
jgi:hypothetical protein